MPRKKTVVQTSGTPKPLKPASLGPLPTVDELKALFKDAPNFEVLSRRFLSPNLPGSLPILLNDESADCCVNSEHINRLRPGAVSCHICSRPARKWYVRWFNLAKENRNAEMRQLAYLPVQIAELQDANDISDLYRSKEDQFVRRGDRGQEVLAKQPIAAFNYIKAKQREAWNATALQPKKVKASLANAAGATFGDEAGQTIHDGEIQVERFNRRQTSLENESEPMRPNPGDYEFAS